MRKWPGLLMIFAVSAWNIHADESRINFTMGSGGDFFALDGAVKFARFQKESKRRWSARYVLSRNQQELASFSSPIFNPGHRGCDEIEDKNVDFKAQRVEDEGIATSSDLSYSRSVQVIAGGLLIEAKIPYRSLEREAKDAKLYCYFPETDPAFQKTVHVNGEPLATDGKSDALLKETQDNPISSFRIKIAADMDLGILFLAPTGQKVLYRLKNTDERTRVDIPIKDYACKYYVCLLRPDEKLHAPEEILAPGKTETAVLTPRKGNLIPQGSSFESGPFDGFTMFSRSAWMSSVVPAAKEQPSIDPGTSVFGAHSLRLPIPLARCAVIFNRVKFEMGRPYTFSAYMKADAPISVRFGVGSPLLPETHVYNKQEGHIFMKTVTLTNEWKRYSISFTPEKCQLFGYWPMGIAIEESKKQDEQYPNAHVWVDGVQLEEGELSDYVPAEKLELGAALLNKYRLVKKGEAAKVQLYFRNNTEKPVSGKVSYVLKDYWENIARSGETEELAIPPGKNLESSLDLGSALPRGYYRCYFKGPLDTEEEIVFGVYSPQPLTKTSEQWPFGKHEPDDDPIARELGFGWCRVFTHFSLNVVAREDGSFDFTEPDKVLDNAEKTGINLMPILDARVGRLGPKNNPWFVGRKFKNIYHDIGFPTPELWAEYVKAVVGRYKGKIRHWEIMNEPNTYMTPENYLEYLKAAYEAAKEADPEAVVIGLCATADMAGKPLPWSQKVIELGGWKYMDAASLHLYGKDKPEAFHQLGIDKVVDTVRAFCAEKGKKDIPVWDTEKNTGAADTGFSRKKFNVPTEYHYSIGRCVGSFKDKGENFIRQGILSANVGRGPFFWHTPTLPNERYAALSYWAYLNGPDYQEFDFSPRPELIAVNGLASLMKDKVGSEGEVAWSDASRCYLFKVPDGILAAVYNWKNGATARMALGDTTFQLFNYFGEPIETTPDKNGEITVSLDTAPKYILFKNMTADACRAALKKTVTNGPDDLVITPGLSASKTGNFAFSADIHNRTGMTITGKIEIAAVPAGWRFEETQKDFSVQGGETETAAFALSSVKPVETIEKIRFTVNGREFTSGVIPFKTTDELKNIIAPRTGHASAAKVAPGDIKIDGDLGEWENKPATYIVRTDDERWKGPADSAVKLAFAWDDQNLYFAARVYDDDISTPQTESLFGNDSVEFFLDLSDSDLKDDQNAGESAYTLNKDDFHWVVAIGTPMSANPVCWFKYLKDSGNAELAAKRLPDGYIIEGAFPWKTFNRQFEFAPKESAEVGFTFILNDCDKMEQKRIIWAGDQGANKTPKTWGRLKFE